MELDPNATRCAILIEKTLDEREQRIITQVCAKLAQGTLDPQEAVQEWMAVQAGRQLKASLLKKTRA